MHFLIWTLLLGLGQLNAAIPVTPKASPEAKALLNFMFDMYGKKRCRDRCTPHGE